MDFTTLAQQAAARGDWDEATRYARFAPASHDAWQKLPQAAGQAGIPPEEAHKILDFLTGPYAKGHASNLPSFLYEYSTHLPPNADPRLLNRMADLARDDYLTTTNIHEHPRWQPDEATKGLMDVGDFWNEYERKVGPHHFATIKAMYEGKPVEHFRDHRGQEGDSLGHMHLMPHFQSYAQRAQAEVLKEANENRQWKPADWDSAGLEPTRVRYFNNEPFVQAYRGVSGDYGQAVATAAGLDWKTGHVDKKTLTLPAAHLGSWTTSIDMAKRFALNRDKIAGQYKAPLVMQKWMPLRHLLHTGYHTVVTNQKHAHTDEYELVFGHPEAHVKIQTKDLRFAVHDKKKSSPGYDHYDLKPVQVRDYEGLHGHAEKIRDDLPARKQPGKFSVENGYAWKPAGAGEPLECLHCGFKTSNIDEKDEHEQGHRVKKSEPDNLLGRHAQVVSAMLGNHQKLQQALVGARFLAGGRAASIDRLRRALWEANGDAEKGALRAHGLAVDEKNLRALRAMSKMDGLGKVEVAADDVPLGSRVHPVVPEAADAAAAVKRAFDDHFVVAVKLGGKHSAGSLLARDPQTSKVYLLKPGSGGQSPAAGAKDDPSSQSRREGAFYHVAEAWGLGNFVPEAEVVWIDGKEYAALVVLPWSYKTMEAEREQDAAAVQRVLQPYLHSGDLHKWAALDYVLGDPDRHAQNIMVGPNKDVKLIDHGSAFAGENFNPAFDRNSFVPFYLRAWAPEDGFNQLDTRSRMRYMPRAGLATQDDLKNWLGDLSEGLLERVLSEYGIDPRPSVERLSKLKALAHDGAADDVINRLWVSGE